MRALVTRSKRILWAALLSLALLPFGGTDSARAEEVMQFKPVPPESASKSARSNVRQHRAPASPDQPDQPATPDVPDAPDPNPNLPGRSGDIMRLGSDVFVERNQVVDGDVVSIGGDVRIDGQVRGDVAALGGDLHLGSSSRVDGDVTCLGGQLKEEDGAYVGGQRVTALSKHRVKVIAPHSDFQPFVGVAKIVNSIVGMLVLLAFCWAYITFAPQRSAIVVATLKHEPGPSLLVGFISMILIVPSLVALALVMAILCITIIGIPVAIAALFVYFGLVFVLISWGFVAGAAWIGLRIPIAGPTPVSILRAALVGTIAIMTLRIGGAVVQLIPFVGWIGGLARFAGIVGVSLAVMMGAGALIRSKLGQGPEGRWWPILRTGPKPGGPVPVAPVAAGATVNPGAPATESAPPSPMS